MAVRGDSMSEGQQVSWMNEGRLIYCDSEHFKFVRQKQAISRAVCFIVDGKRTRRLVILNCGEPIWIIRAARGR